MASTFLVNAAERVHYSQSYKSTDQMKHLRSLAQTIPNVDTHKTVNSYLINKTSSAFKFKLVTEEDIFKIISKLDSKNSTGYDQISSDLLKRINEYIHKQKIYNNNSHSQSISK